MFHKNKILDAIGIEMKFFEALYRQAQKKIQNFFDTRTVFQIVGLVISYIIALLVGLADVLNLVGKKWEQNNYTTYILMAAIVIVGMVGLVDLYHFQRLNFFNARAKKLASALGQVGNRLEYKITKMELSRQLYENGDVAIHRIMNISATTTDVHLILIGVWLVNVEPRNSHDLNFRAYNKVNVPLDVTEIKGLEDNKEYAIVLDPPAVLGAPTVVRTTHDWKGAWLPLFTIDPNTGIGKDTGQIEVSQEVDEYEMTFTLPHGWEFTDCEINRPALDPPIATINPPEYYINQQGQSCLKVTASNLKPQEVFNYHLYAKRQS